MASRQGHSRSPRRMSVQPAQATLAAGATTTTAGGLSGLPEKGVAVVTGGSRGIGAAVAQSLALGGYAVVVNYQAQGEAAAEVVKSICDAGGRAVAIQADVSKEGDVVRLFEGIEKHWPGVPLTALVNNAGMLSRNGLGDITTENFDAIFHTNVLGPLFCTREFVKRAAAGAAVVNLSSGSAVISNGLYGMTKAALNSMQAWLVNDLAAKHIRMNSVSPGMTDTDMIAETRENFDMKQIPLGRFGKPSEIADAVEYLLSEKASYVTGANLRVAGGRPPGNFIG